MNELNDYPEVKNELLNHVLDKINDGVLTDDNKDEWHFLCFIQDYYIIGYYDCSQWLKKHEIDPFQAVAICQEYEENNFGEITTKYDNSEKTVNMLAYIFGEELIYSFESETIEDLEEEIKNELE